jgi:hypothetical protein
VWERDRRIAGGEAWRFRFVALARSGDWLWGEAREQLLSFGVDELRRGRVDGFDRGLERVESADEAARRCAAVVEEDLQPVQEFDEDFGVAGDDGGREKVDDENEVLSGARELVIIEMGERREVGDEALQRGVSEPVRLRVEPARYGIERCRVASDRRRSTIAGMPCRCATAILPIRAVR